MKRSFFLSTFLFAAVLSPVTLQPYTCGPPPEQARLAILELRVGSFAGENTIEGFNPNVFSYDVRFPESESVGVLWVKTNHPSTKVDVEYDGLPVRLVGQSVAELDVPLGSSELTIHVTRPGTVPDAKTYVVHIERVPVFACTEQGIRDAIARGGGPNYFDCDGPTHVPTAAEIAIDNDVILDGEGNLIADAGGGGGAGGNGAGGGAFMAIEVAPKANGPHRVFYIPEGVTAELSGFTVTGGMTAEAGGGILNAGTLTLANSVVSGNTARFGGGVRNEGQVDVIDTVVSDNYATQAAGGITNRPGATMTLTGATVQGNIAAGNVGGIGNTSGTLTLNDTTVSGNEAGGEAGGIRNSGDGTLVLTGGAVSGNTAVEFGGGLWNSAGGSASLENTTVSFNSGLYGGGIANREGSMALVGTTVHGNTATSLGGGIYNEAATLTVIDGEVSRNTTLTAQGGGILNSGGASANLENTTVSFNSSSFGGGGISNDSLGTTMVLIGATVQGNTAIADGGGINNGGTLRVVDSVVAANTSDNFGGGIANSGNITVINTTLSENTATTDGGGIGNSTGGTAELSETTFSLNSASIYGGGISNRPDANMTLTGITVHGNTAEAEGAGGVANAGTMTMRKSIASSNTALQDGGGILNTETGAITLMTTTVTENSAGTWGGGIRNFGAMDIMDTTVSDNTAQGGGGISNRPGAWMALTNSTVSGNGGNGISNWSTLTLASVTLSENRIFNDGGWITARNTIVDTGCDAAPLVNSLGGNVESPGNTCFVPHPSDQVSLTPEQANLGPLQDNGGPTWTHALLPGSFAIDSVVECVNPWGFPLFVDQRGASRPHGPACDAGSFELGGVLLPQDQCVNDADRNTYESLVYVNSDGYLVTCISAAAEMATDCIFGSAQSSPPIVGCPTQAAAVIACYPSCPPETFEAFGDCVASCTTEVTGLSAECAGCYGALAECAAQVCLVECAGDPDSPECDLCRSQSRCNMIYDGCSGLPGSTDCGTGGTGGVGGSGGSGGSPADYTQDFESLDQASPTALGDDGWLVFGQVVDANGVLKFGYGPFPAPNGTPGFSSIVAGEGSPNQGAQQMVVYNDYNCCSPDQGHFNGTDRVASSVFRQPFTATNPISAADVGETVEFSFDAKRGNINDPTGSSTALAFIQALDPGFTQTNFVQIDMTNLPAGTWGRYSISLTIDPSLVGQYLEFGFLNTASNFEPSGVFYDNILFETGAGGSGGTGGTGGTGAVGGGTGGSGGAPVLCTDGELRCSADLTRIEICFNDFWEHYEECPPESVCQEDPDVSCAAPSVIVGDGIWDANGHQYVVVEFRAQTWNTSNADLSNQLPGFHLATITSQEEQDFVNNLVAGLASGELWLGGFQDPITELNPAAGWTWVTGEPWAYTNWLSGEPNDTIGVEQHLALDRGGWNDEGSAIGAVGGYLAESFDPVAP